MKTAARLWRENRLALVVFVAALLLAGLFLARAVLFWLVWHDPAQRDMALEGWMTPRFVAHSWQVDREVVMDALDLEAGDGRRITLSELARERGVPLDRIEAALMAAIEADRASR